MMNGEFYLGHYHGYPVVVNGKFKVYETTRKSAHRPDSRWERVTGTILKNENEEIAKFSYLDHPTSTRELMSFSPQVEGQEIAYSEEGYYLSR
jgi:hypothetical protein